MIVFNLLKAVLFIFLLFLLVSSVEIFRSLLKKDYLFFGKKTNFELFPDWFRRFSILFIPFLALYVLFQMFGILVSWW